MTTLQEPNLIKSWLDSYDIMGYRLEETSTGFITHVNQSVVIVKKTLAAIPIQFGIIEGDFLCFDNNLTSLENSPIEVLGSFNCNNNRLTSLRGGPKIVKGPYSCSHNKIESLEGIEIAKDNLICNYNKLKNLQGLAHLNHNTQTVYGNFYINHNELCSLEGGPLIVHGNYHAEENKLTSLLGVAHTIEKNLYVEQNPITQLLQIPNVLHTFNIDETAPHKITSYGKPAVGIRTNMTYPYIYMSGEELKMAYDKERLEEEVIKITPSAPHIHKI